MINRVADLYFQLEVYITFYFAGNSSFKYEYFIILSGTGNINVPHLPSKARTLYPPVLIKYLYIF